MKIFRRGRELIRAIGLHLGEDRLVLALAVREKVCKERLYYHDARIQLLNQSIIETFHTNYSNFCKIINDQH